MDSRGKICRPSGEWASPSATILCAGMFDRGLPSKVMRPPEGLSSPDSVRRVVVLPAPLVPMSVTTWPASTVKEIPLTASILP
ncbi:hypothetical protein GCM10010394_45790 [Streptomyces crystallinus]|uniref:Uncharacterized protein n=1 Tax=Streptomyces crystallinus TaxID=68191 RepID=A0ABP3RN66_9ACTN